MGDETALKDGRAERAGRAMRAWGTFYLITGVIILGGVGWMYLQHHDVHFSIPAAEIARIRERVQQEAVSEEFRTHVWGLLDSLNGILKSVDRGIPVITRFLAFLSALLVAAGIQMIWYANQIRGAIGPLEVTGDSPLGTS